MITKSTRLAIMALLAYRNIVEGMDNAVHFNTGIRNVALLEQIASDIYEEGLSSKRWLTLANQCGTLRNVYRQASSGHASPELVASHENAIDETAKELGL